MSEPWRYCVKRNKPAQQAMYFLFHWYKTSRIGRFIVTESRLVLPRSGKRRRWWVTANGFRVSFWNDEYIWEWDCDGSCTILWICYTHLIVCFKIMNYKSVKEKDNNKKQTKWPSCGQFMSLQGWLGGRFPQLALLAKVPVGAGSQLSVVWREKILLGSLLLLWIEIL